MFVDLIEKVNGEENLTHDEVILAADALVSAEVENAEKKAFLLGLREKGESVEEVVSFAETFRERARDPGLSAYADRAIDVCGTGGDGSGSFNISTLASFILAAAGVPVFKHGNRSITSKCGSADLLEAVGIELVLEDDILQDSVKELNFCFLFAPNFHPAFKEIMPVRKEIAEEKKGTIFNILGPLINPGKPSHQLLGVFSDSWVQPLADTLGALGLRRGLVVHGLLGEDCGMDELTCAGDNTVAGFGEFIDVDSLWSPKSLGLEICSIEDLAGGSVEENLALMKKILDGKGRQGLVDTVVLNAGAGLWVSGKADTIFDGLELAREVLLGGKLSAWLKKVKAFYNS